MIHYFRLVRPVNLFIILLTMYGIKWLTESRIKHREIDLDFNSLHFFLLVLSVLLIAASGNIINDYFDVKADRINKPDKLIISKHIKRRWAIVLNWILNAIAFAIGIYLSFVLKTYWIIIFHFTSINILWFYSVYFKRKVLIGNLLIAILTAMVPLIVWVYLKSEIRIQDHKIFDGHPIRNFSPGQLIILLTFLAFIQNWIREIIKDAQDVIGDKAIKAKTLPMVVDKKTLSIILTILLSILPIYFCLKINQSYQTGIIRFGEESVNHLNLFISILTRHLPILLASIINIFTIVLAWRLNSINYKLMDKMIKLSLVIGLLLPIYKMFYMQ